MLLQQLQLFVHCVHCMPSSSCNTQHEVDAGVKIPAAGEHHSVKELQALQCPALHCIARTTVAAVCFGNMGCH
jgi:hypothetical protein